MFSASALKAMSAEEAQDTAERTAETSTAAAATATVEAASADADLGSQGLPAQHILDHGIGAQWSPCIVFPTHSGLPVCHV